MSDRVGPVEKLWRGFESATISPRADAEQRRQMRAAFYAGSFTLFSLIMAGLSPGGEAEPCDIAMLDAIDEELQRYCADLMTRTKPEGKRAS